MVRKYVLLSPEGLVALSIFNLTKDGGIAHYSSIVEYLKDDISKVTVSKALDNLSDCGMIESRWVRKGFRWVHSVRISDGAKRVMNEINLFMRLGDLEIKTAVKP